MQWIYLENEKPICYLTGDWDGKKSDEILVEDKDGKKHLAVLYSGFIDGHYFDDWYNSDGYEIENIIKFLKIPE